MYQRLALLASYLTQPKIAGYVIAEAQGIRGRLQGQYESGAVMGDALVAALEAGDRKKALEIVDELIWLVNGGDKAVAKAVTNTVPRAKPAPKPAAKAMAKAVTKAAPKAKATAKDVAKTSKRSRPKSGKR